MVGNYFRLAAQSVSYIRKPQNDEEFVAEYWQYSPREQKRRLSLFGNIPAAALERRL